MNGAFLALTLLAAVLLVNWRIVLVLLFAGLIALVILGMGAVHPENLNAVGLPAFITTVSPGDIGPPPT
ncbi:hypothetical protein ACQEVB_05710 [Pseudonocardia sp. CA-107938]|uniref:hypothetical protein n=1 Tax=Pseudonocardia sp. CA-107938 TaxID=3240021 RepID=UPI003D8EC446